MRINLVKRGSEPLLIKDEPFQFNEKEKKYQKIWSTHNMVLQIFIKWQRKKIEDLAYSKSKIYLLFLCFCRLFADIETELEHLALQLALKYARN